MANQRELPRDMSFVDRRGNVVHPSRKDYHVRKSVKVGKAYAFFDCNVSKGDIEKEIPFIRECVKTPSNLELSLTEGVENFWEKNKSTIAQGIALRDIPQLMTMLQEAKDSGMRYVLEAKYEGATNRQTADELSAILNQAYQSPLYQEGEGFRGEIVYKERGRYVFRE